MSTSWSERVIDLGYLRLAAKHWSGQGSGPPLLALHGWLDNAASFDRLLPRLNFSQCLALDLPGHGLSEHRPIGMAYQMVDSARDVVAVLEALQWSECVLLGHSMGSAIALMVAAAFPEKITKIVLIDGLGALSEESAEKGVENLRKSIQQQLSYDPARKVVYAQPEQALEARMRVGDMEREATEVLLSRGLMAVEGGVTWRSDPRLRITSPQRFAEPQLRAQLAAVTAPILLLSAEQGLLTRYPQLLERLESTDQVQRQHLAGGHHLHLDQPQACAEMINPFLASCSE